MMYGDKVPQPIYSDINKIHISVKSTEKSHLSRVSILLLTWFQTVPPKNVSPLAFSESSCIVYTCSIVVFNYWRETSSKKLPLF